MASHTEKFCIFASLVGRLQNEAEQMETILLRSFGSSTNWNLLCYLCVSLILALNFFSTTIVKISDGNIQKHINTNILLVL